jgi:hypothetical protein
MFNLKNMLGLDVECGHRYLSQSWTLELAQRRGMPEGAGVHIS